MSQLDQMVAWEQGELDTETTIHLFADLVKSGLAWTLQGTYGRTAKRFIDAGYISHRREKY